MSASGWTLGGYGLAQLVRFGGNLALTRLLFPEAFGTMALVQATLTGVGMLSDLGIEQAIIQNRLGATSKFVDTAWTMQILRGIGIWLICCALALPVSKFYDNSEIFLLLPCVGLTAILNGLASPRIPIAGRELGLARITMLEVTSSILSMICTIIFAWLSHSVWALVVGGLIGASSRTMLSYVWLSGHRSSLRIDRQCARALLTFGAWIFVSTSLTFLLGEGNRLVIAKFLSLSELAFYSIATSLTLLPIQIIQQLSARVLFPAYSEIMRERPDQIARVIGKVRLWQIVPIMISSSLLIAFKNPLVDFLYDHRYQPVSQMIGLVALATLPQSIIVSYGPILIAQGRVRQSTILLGVQLIIQLLCVIAGGSLGGASGILVGLALAQWLLYPFYAYTYARLSIWQPTFDAIFGGMAAFITIATLQTQFKVF